MEAAAARAYVAARVGSAVAVTLPDGRTVEGIWKAVDKEGNIVLAHAKARAGEGTAMDVKTVLVARRNIVDMKVDMVQ